MNKSEVLGRIKIIGIVPVVRAPIADEAMRAADALVAGGVPVLEITMTVPGALAVIEQFAKDRGAGVIVGAGTVLDSETARACILAGAQFVVSPVLDARVIATCRRYAVACLPGALTPTEVLAAWEAGADAVKVFPCDAMGGARYLKSLKAPLPQIEMIPTGGVSLDSAAALIHAGAFALGVGGELVDLTELRADRAHVITERARRFVEVVREARANLTEQAT